MLWNPDQNPEPLREEFIRLYYGPAAPYVKRHIERYEAHYKRLLETTNFNDWLGKNTEAGLTYFPKAFVQEQIAVLDEGIAALNKNPGLSPEQISTLSLRVKEVRLKPLYKLWKHAKEYRVDEKKAAQQFFGDCDEIGVRCWGLNKFISDLRDGYISSFEGMLE